jgi:choline dehydrogenase-like flavoprotein
MEADFVVVGSGAGGAVTFARLAAAGKRVVLLEEGNQVDSDILGGSITNATMNLYRNAGLTPIIGRPMIPFGEGRCLGGTTEINGGLVWRTPDWVRSEWKMLYKLNDVFGPELDTHFDEIENRLQVTRTGPHLEGNRDSEILRLGAQRLNWSVSEVPRAAPQCQNSNRCGSGCPTGAKRSMSLTYIEDAVANGGHVLTGVRVERIVRRGGKFPNELKCRSTTTRLPLVIAARVVIVAAGTTQTPLLLGRSGLISRHSSFCFHTNLKILAEFDEIVEARKGTILTWQIQEFERERTLMMATNLAPEYVAMSHADLRFSELQEINRRIDHYGLYTTQVAPQTRGRIYSLGDTSYLFHRLSKSDFHEIKIGIMRCARALIVGGAKRLLLPIQGSPPVCSVEDAEKVIENAVENSLRITSVHAMSSCRIGISPSTSRVRPDGRLWGHDDIFVLDGSILPSWTIESPQGTIMATASLLASHIASTS